MSRLFQHFMWTLLILGLSSCLTIEEVYTFNQDGSGEMELAFDLKQLIMFVEEGPQRDSIFMMGAIFDEMAPQLEELDGITRVEPFTDKEEMRVGLRYQFSNIDALNQALNQTLIVDGQDGHVFFTQEGKAIQRVAPGASDGLTLVDAVAQSFMEEGADPQEAEMVLAILKYQTKYTFNKRVKAVYAAAEAEVTGDNRENVLVKTTFDELMDDRAKLDAAFVLK